MPVSISSSQVVYRALKDAGVRIVSALPRDRVVTETDGPYCKLGGRTAEPQDIPAVIQGLARVWGEDAEQARERVFASMASVAACAAPTAS